MSSPLDQDGRRQRSAETRTQLLDAASKLFARAGFEGTSLEHIAQSAGVHKALIRYHFGSKSGLYAAVLRDGIGVGRALLAPVRSLDRPAGERLEAYVDAIVELFARRPNFAPTIVREWMDGGRHVDPQVMSEFLHFFQVDREILEQGVERGELRATDPHATHLTLVGSLVFFEVTRPLREHHSEAPALPSEAFRDHVKAFLRRGLQL